MEGAGVITTNVYQRSNLDIPKEFRLEQNYPNPFNPITKIDYQIAASADFVLRVYDTLGREVETLVKEVQNPGYYSVQFNASTLSNGVYYYKLETGKYYDTKKLLLLK